MLWSGFLIELHSTHAVLRQSSGGLLMIGSVMLELLETLEQVDHTGDMDKS